MSEIITSETEHYGHEAVESFQLLDMLTHDILIQQEAAKIEHIMQDRPDIKALAELYARRVELYKEDVSPENDQQLKEVDGLINKEPYDLKAEYRKLERRRESLSRGLVLLDRDSIEAQRVLGDIHAAPTLNSTTPTEAPFSGWRENTPELWKHVPEDEVDKYLKDRLFVGDIASQVYRDEGSGRGVRIEAEYDDTIDIPTDIFVFAQGFDSWHGRDGYGSHKDVAGEYAYDYDRKIHSSELIKHYASLPSELPPISDVTVYVQPNGLMFADNGAGDSHRLGAAILRGQELMKVRGVTVKPVEHNYFPLPVEQDAHV